MFEEGEYGGEEYTGTRGQQSEVAHRVFEAVNDVRHQQPDEFLIRVPNRCLTSLSSVFCKVLHFLIADPCKAMLCDRRLTNVATDVVYHTLFLYRVTDENIPISFCFGFERGS